MQIQILSVTQQTAQGAKGPYQLLEIAYKNLTFQGKVESKKILPFGSNKDTFNVLSSAKPTDVYDIDVVKNDKGYNDWVKATKGHATAEQPPAEATAPRQATGVTKGGWETPEERAKKQVYIIRQSSLSTAVAALAIGTKKAQVTAEDVIELAKSFESYVFGTTATETFGEQGSESLEDITEDIPL